MTEVVPCSLVGGAGVEMFIDHRIGTSVLRGQCKIRYQISNPSRGLQAPPIGVSLLIKHAPDGEFINKEGCGQMQFSNVPGTDVDEHLRIGVTRSAMVEALPEKEWNPVSQLNLFIIND